MTGLFAPHDPDKASIAQAAAPDPALVNSCNRAVNCRSELNTSATKTRNEAILKNSALMKQWARQGK